MKQTTFSDTASLNAAFAKRVAELLKRAIESRGQASLLVSGGRTPLPFFQQLKEEKIDWSKVIVSLADERWVAADDTASNEKLVTENLLQGNAASAKFLSLKTNDANAQMAIKELTDRFSQVTRPFDVVILGMGEDGHTASLFPCSEQIEQGLDRNNTETFIAVTPGEAPHQRMSFTFTALMNSKNLFLHLTGDAKKAVFEQALAGNDELEMPIRAFLHNTDIELIWAP